MKKPSFVRQIYVFLEHIVFPLASGKTATKSECFCSHFFKTTYQLRKLLGKILIKFIIFVNIVQD